MNTTFKQNMKKLTFACPPATVFFFQDNEDRRSTYISDKQHFKLRILETELLLTSMFLAKKHHFSVCNLLDHTMCKINKIH